MKREEIFKRIARELGDSEETINARMPKMRALLPDANRWLDEEIPPERVEEEYTRGKASAVDSLYRMKEDPKAVRAEVRKFISQVTEKN